MPGPTRDHTERMLAWLGAPVRREGYVTTVEGPAGFEARTIDVPGDISGAAAWLVAGALHPDAHIVIEDVGLNPSRTGIIDVLREMGADIKVASDGPTEWCPEPIGTIIVRGGRPLRAIDLSGDRVADVIDELPLIAIAMAAAEGAATVSGCRGAAGQGVRSHRPRGRGAARHRRRGRGAPGRLGRLAGAPRGTRPSTPPATTASRWRSRSPR